MGEKKVHYLQVTEREMVALIHAVGTVEFSFGVGGAALTWTEGEPITPAIEYLALLRGVANENMHGAGI